MSLGSYIYVLRNNRNKNQANMCFGFLSYEFYKKSVDWLAQMLATFVVLDSLQFAHTWWHLI